MELNVNFVESNYYYVHMQVTKLYYAIDMILCSAFSCPAIGGLLAGDS